MSPPIVPNGPVEQNNFLTQIIADPVRPYVYLANDSNSNLTSGGVSQYVIEPGGTLTSQGLAIQTGGTLPTTIAVDPTGQYLYQAIYHDIGGVSWHSIGPGGALSAAAGNNDIAAGVHPDSVVVDPTGHYVFIVNNGSNSVSEYAIGTGGALTPLSPATVSTGNFPDSIAVTAAH